MSRPIDIPTPTARQTRTRHHADLFPAADGPYFGFIEVMTDGTVLWAISSGEGKFIKVGPRRDLPPLAFVVEKDRILKKITIEITSITLRQTLHRAILDTAPSSTSLHLDFETLLQNYEALKSHLYRLQCQSLHSEVAMEAGLLITDLLLESNLYDGIGMEGFRQRKVLCATHIRDIHQRNLDFGLDEIQDCFALGLIPDSINEEYMEALNEKYALLARSGDLHALQNLCEPIVRSGEISMQYNPSLLVEVLENEDFEMYQYMLALVERTRDEEEEPSDQQLPDVTFDPFHVAIRLGRLQTVQNFISENAYFEGRVAEHSCFGVDCLITPLTSSVLWQRPDITRLLLASDCPLYRSSYSQAVELAFSSDFIEVQQVLSEFNTEPASTPMAPSSFGTTSVLPGDISPMEADSPGFPFLPEYMEHNDQGKHDRDQALSTLVEFPIEDICFPPPMDPTFTSNDIDPQMLMTWSSVDTLPTELSPIDLSPPFKQNASQFETPDARASATEAGNTPAVASPQAQPFARQTSSYTARRKAGQSITQLLEAQFVKIRNLCNERRQDGEYLQLLRRLSGLEEVWSTGIRTFKGIYRNRPPEGLFEMLCCLLVADAMSMQASLFEHGIHSRFVSDISRWRTVVNDDDKHVFDEICSILWQVDNLYEFADTDHLSKMQGFIQDLVSIDKVEARLPQRPGRQGSRLQTIYGRKGKQKEVCRCAQLAPCMESLGTDEFSGLSSTLSLSGGAHQNSEGLIDLSDFIYLDAPGVENMEDEHFAEPNSSWKAFLTSIKPTVVLLLASVAFSIVLSFISGHEDPGSCCSNIATRGNYIPFLLMSLVDYDKAGDQLPSTDKIIQSSASIQQSARITQMKESSSQSYKRVLSRQAFTTWKRPRRQSIHGSTGSPGSSSLVSTDLSSTDTARSPERLRCLSHNCPKAFSSVSNRNKHMREGCAFRDKKGYPCRNTNCSKVLTTKWYRNTHEQTRCRFR